MSTFVNLKRKQKKKTFFHIKGIEEIRREKYITDMCAYVCVRACKHVCRFEGVASSGTNSLKNITWVFLLFFFSILISG